MIIVKKEMYKTKRKCDNCTKETKLVLPIDYLLRFQPEVLKNIKENTNFKNLCWNCVNDINK
jgi:hypothetical protein